MPICMKCKKYMKAMHTGAVLRWGYDHCYSSDIFKCIDCGAEIANPAIKSFKDSSDSPDIYQMD